MAKITIAQMKEFMDLHENTILKIFNDKIERLEAKIFIMQEENKTLKTEVCELKKSMEFINEKYERVLTETKKNLPTSNEKNKNIKIFENEDIKDKMAELEDRSRRNNLRINGIDESLNETWEQSEKKVQEFLKSKLGFETDFSIERAHRVGKNRADEKSRTIIVKFLNYKDKSMILENYVKIKLWNQHLYINEDFSERTNETRKRLFIEAKELRLKVIFQSTDDSSQNQYPSAETNYNTPEDECDEDDDDEVESLVKKNEPQKAVSAERLKAFNMFVRLFIDENLDRLVPISKQPKEKINAIIMSCQRQFPEFEDRARKRIRTYLKSCRRSIRLREDTSKPTLYQPATHPPEISHILAQACQNESHEAAKRQRLDVDKDSQKNGFLSSLYGKKDAISPPFISSTSSIELTHAEVVSIKTLIDGYRQSASFLHRSADELESILKNVRSPKVDSVKKEENRCPHGELLVSSAPMSELKRKADQFRSLEPDKQWLSSSSPTKSLFNSFKIDRNSPSKFNFREDSSPNKTTKTDAEISPRKPDNSDTIEHVEDDISENFNQKQSSSISSRFLEPNHLDSNVESDESVEAHNDTSKLNTNEVYHVSENLNEGTLIANHSGAKPLSYQNNVSEILYITESNKSRVERNVLKDKSQVLTPIYSKRPQYTSVQHNRNLSPVPTTISLDNYERFEIHQQRHPDSERIFHHSNMTQQLRNANSTYNNLHSIHMSSSSQSPCSDDISYDIHQKRITQDFYAETPSPKHSSANISLYTKTQLSPKLHSQFSGNNLRSQTVLYSPRQQPHQVRYHIGQQSRQNQLNNYTVFNFDSPSPQAYYENRHQHQQQNFHSVVSPHSYHVISPNHSPLVQDLSKQTHFSDINRQSNYQSSHGEYTHFDVHPMNK